MDEWLDRWPKADWAIRHTNSVVLDVEMKNGLNGIEDLKQFIEEDDNGPVVRTKSGGLHIWFSAPADAPDYGVHIKDSIEIKYKNASAHIPPSMGYSWIRPACPVSELPPLPASILKAWKENAYSRPAGPVYQQEKYTEGNRHLLLCSMAKALRGIGLNEQEMMAAMIAIKNNRCEGSFDDAQVLAIVRSYVNKRIDDPMMAAIAGDPSALLVCKLLKNMGAL